MKIKMFARLLALITLFCVPLVNCSSGEKSAPEKSPSESTIVKNDLPNLTFTLTNNNQVQARDLKGKVMLILFQPDCDHCQNEAKQIKATIESFKDYTLYFISSAGMPEIQKFASDYQLAGYSNVVFGFTPGQSVLDNFGPIPAPSIYIYQDAKLIHNFNGEVEIDVVKKYL